MDLTQMTPQQVDYLLRRIPQSPDRETAQQHVENVRTWLYHAHRHQEVAQ